LRYGNILTSETAWPGFRLAEICHPKAMSPDLREIFVRTVKLPN
jgi:hypothetical protein